MNSNTLNPIFSIWTKPRATMQQILKTEKSVWPSFFLFIGASFFNTLNQVSLDAEKSLSVSYSALIIKILLSTLIGGLVGYVVLSVLLRWTGRWIGGQASPRDLDLFMGWSRLPEYWLALFWIPFGLIFGTDMFLAEMPEYEPWKEGVFFLLIFMAFPLGIWAFVVWLKCLAEVQQFSAWKALLNAFLTFMLIFIPLFIIIILYSLISTLMAM